MNELSTIFQTAKDDSVVELEKGRIYHVRQDDSFELDGYFCSNSAKRDENPTGHRFTPMFLEGRKNITVDGSGASVVIHGKMTSFLFSRCENITVKNLTVDYAVPTMAEFEILENDGGVLTVRINPDILFRVEGNALIWQGEIGADGRPYWEDPSNGPYRLTRLFDPVSELFSPYLGPKAFTFASIERLDERTLRCTLEDKDLPIPKGRVAQSRNIIRDQVGGMFERCRNLSFENLRIRFMHGLGMVCQFCDTVTYKNCDFTPGEGRTNASTADFFHFSGCRGLLEISGCRARGAQDDFINVHGTHLRIMACDRAEKTMLMRFCHDESWGFQAFEAGDRLEFIRWDTLIPYAETTVTDYEKVSPTDILLHVTDVPEGVVPGKDVAENASWTSDVRIADCTFGPSAGRGVLCTTRGRVVIENNLFDRNIGAALVVEDDCNFWFESGYTRDITFRNNTVNHCNYQIANEASAVQFTPKVMNRNSRAFVHGKLTVEKNRFQDPANGRHTIWLEYLEEADLRDNTFDAPLVVYTNVCGSVHNENRTGERE